jgi:hypothetical protein
MLFFRLQEEADNFYLISIVETLSHSNSVKMLADEVVIYPNIRPVNQKILGIDIPGTRVKHFTTIDRLFLLIYNLSSISIKIRS